MSAHLNTPPCINQNAGTKYLAASRSPISIGTVINQRRDRRESTHGGLTDGPGAKKLEKDRICPQGFLALAILSASGLVSWPVAFSQSPSSATEDAKLRERAMKLHREAIVIDTHNDITSAITDVASTWSRETRAAELKPTSRE